MEWGINVLISKYNTGSSWQYDMHMVICGIQDSFNE